MAFKHLFSFTTVLVAKFGCYHSRIQQDIVSKLLLAAICSDCKFNWNLMSFLWQVVDLEPLLCTGLNNEPEDLFLCLIFTQKPMNNQKIELFDGCSFDL